MADKSKLLYIIVHDGPLEKQKKNTLSTFRYTRPVLQSTLQLIGCKTRHAFKISKRVFEFLREEFPPDRNGSTTQEFFKHDFSRHLSDSEIDNNKEYLPEDIKRAAEENEIMLKEISKKLYDVQKKRCTVVLSRDDFMDVVCNAMSEYRYLGPNQRIDFALASKVRERRVSVTILLCGTSGCGKSTLSTLLASRLGITTVVSTDSIRHMMRSFVDEKENPLLYASTYSAGEYLDPVAVAEAKAKKVAKKFDRRLGNTYTESSQIPSSLPNGRDNGRVQCGKDNASSAESDIKGKADNTSSAESDIKGKAPLIIEGKVSEITVSSKTMAVQGYKAQSEMVIDSLDRLITSWEQKCESVIVEGVHLSLNFVMGLMKKHPSIIPFMVYIANEEKHLERFAVRAKYMTLDPAKNKYVKYIRNIRAIQDHLCKRADKHLIPKVNNTNMDQSVASIHATIFASLRKREAGEPFYDEMTNTVKVVEEEYKNQCAASSLGSKGMLQIIRRRGSSRQLMALMNDDGSVAKTWPFETGDATRKLIIPDYYAEEGTVYNNENLEVSPVNLHFGNFGLSAWPNDMGGTSHSGSIDGLSSRGEGVEYQSSHLSSHYGSSCSSSPRFAEGAEKELLNENRVSGSDEEQEEDAVDIDSEEELNDGREPQIEDEDQGSVGDQSIGSDEEDEYAAAVDQYDTGESGELDSLGCTNRTHYKVSSDIGCRPNILSHQNTDSGNNGVFVSECDRSQHIISRKTPWEVLSAAEANGKHLHGRSKSLPPLGAILSTNWNDSCPLENVNSVVPRPRF